MEDLYSRIERLGKEHGFKNMTALCKAAGVPRTTMSELNKGRSKDLSKPNAQKFANALNLSLGEIYGEETKKAPTDEGERIPHRDKRELLAGRGVSILLDADAKLTEEQLDDIVNFIQFQQEKNGR